ncbi:MAG TPA: MFS transporter [Actinomycetes bacterium]|nr:MFS transporter [Actinomycetes bacterium]
MSSNRHGWPLVASFAAVAGASQMLWLTYAPVTTEAARHYGVSETAIGWLANVFPLLYVLLAVPAGLALDRRPSSALAFGVVLTGAGGVVRLLGGGFGWALAGQLLVGVAQPFVLNAITGVVQVLPVRSRPTGIAVGSAGLFLGMVVALGMGALAGGDRLQTLMVVQAVLAVIAVVAYLVIAARAPRPAAVASTEEGQLAAVWRDQVLRRLALLAFLGFGVFVALVTWLQALLDPRGVSESAAGTIVTVAVAVGAIGSTVVAAVLEGRPVEAVLLRTTLVAAVGGCLVLAVGSGLASAWIGVVVAVLAMLTALPWLLALCERNARDAVASATALLWLAGNLGGLVIAGVLGLLLDHPGAAFGLLALVALAGLPLVRTDAIGAGVRETQSVADSP